MRDSLCISFGAICSLLSCYGDINIILPLNQNFDPNQPNKCYGQDQHCQVVLGGEGSQGPCLREVKVVWLLASQRGLGPSYGTLYSPWFQFPIRSKQCHVNILLTWFKANRHQSYGSDQREFLAKYDCTLEY